MMVLAVVEGGRWRPGIGDPTVMGWVTVAAYLVAAVGCFWAGWREPAPDGARRPRSGPARFWLALGAFMVALGTNKQLDLQSLVTQIGRDLIRARGLYAERRTLQVGFILLVALGCVGTLAAIFWGARRSLNQRWPAIVGALFILGFVLVRASSFHQVDVLLAARLGGMKWNWVFELGGIAVVGLAAFRVALAEPPRPSRPDNVVTYRYRIKP